jgi:hypothetical protein
MAGIELVNQLHAATDHGEIVWKHLPNPLQHLDPGVQPS